ncbi:MAG TPA: hypothetical protein VJY54_12595 [Lachnospiraceae bacterium]|nr:hypothetical protein [Lachnospiraceae bacterium]
MNMLVSGMTVKGDQKIAYVRFEEDTRLAEGMIPECKITMNTGFTHDEIHQLENYMQENLPMLKRQAAGINPIKAMLQDD